MYSTTLPPDRPAVPRAPCQQSRWYGIRTVTTPYCSIWAFVPFTLMLYSSRSISVAAAATILVLVRLDYGPMEAATASATRNIQSICTETSVAAALHQEYSCSRSRRAPLGRHWNVVPNLHNNRIKSKFLFTWAYTATTRQSKTRVTSFCTWPLRTKLRQGVYIQWKTMRCESLKPLCCGNQDLLRAMLYTHLSTLTNSILACFPKPSAVGVAIAVDVGHTCMAVALPQEQSEATALQ